MPHGTSTIRSDDRAHGPGRLQLGTPCRGFAGASCASGYGGAVLAVVTTLVLVGISLLLVRRGTARLEQAADVTQRVATEGWTRRAEALRVASEDLRDAVAARDPR